MSRSHAVNRNLHKVRSPVTNHDDLPVVGGQPVEAAHSGEAIRQVREHQGLSIRDLSARCGYSPAYLSRLERGLTPPTPAIIEGLVQPLGLTPSEHHQIYVAAAEEYLRSKGWQTDLLRPVPFGGGTGRRE